MWDYMCQNNSKQNHFRLFFNLIALTSASAPHPSTASETKSQRMICATHLLQCDCDCSLLLLRWRGCQQLAVWSPNTWNDTRQWRIGWNETSWTNLNAREKNEAGRNNEDGPGGGNDFSSSPFDSNGNNVVVISQRTAIIIIMNAEVTHSVSYATITNEMEWTKKKKKKMKQQSENSCRKLFTKLTQPRRGPLLGELHIWA